LFIEELETNFRTYNFISEAEAKLKGLSMQENHQAMKYFIKLQQLAACIQWGKAALCRQAYNGLTKCIKDDMSTMRSQTPFPVSGNSCKPSTHDTGNDMGKSPMNPTLPEPLETSPNRSLTPTSLTPTIPTTSLAKVLPISNRTTTTLALPRARAQLPNRRSPPLPTFLQRWKANSTGATFPS